MYRSGPHTDIKFTDVAMGSVAATGLRLHASQVDPVTAWPGGTGHAKIGANYDPALFNHGKSQGAGQDHVLWLFGRESPITEAGGANFFIIWRSSQGSFETVTAPLED